ncbi:hypothetical protein FRB96_004113 [Tulasnella sp. 330]|nr:hypothetical protein FRB96_004113 [Tulasnella sp. 330]
MSILLRIFFLLQHPAEAPKNNLPPEILIAIAGAVTSDTPPGAYTYSSEAKAALCTLGDDQIGRLRTTLLSTTPRATSLANRIHSLRLYAASIRCYRDEDITQASTLFHILAPTLKRLFMDMVLTVETFVKDSIGFFIMLSGLALGNTLDFLWER